MEIDLTPLRLSPREEFMFCIKRIQEQRNYISDLKTRPDSVRTLELTKNASVVLYAWYELAQQKTW